MMFVNMDGLHDCGSEDDAETSKINPGSASLVRQLVAALVDKRAVEDTSDIGENHAVVLYARAQSSPPIGNPALPSDTASSTVHGAQLNGEWKTDCPLWCGQV